MNYTLSDLRRKEVINVCDGARLGFPDDVIIDGCGNVLCLSVPCNSFRWFGKGETRHIPWKQIQRIAEETIWVKSDQA